MQQTVVLKNASLSAPVRFVLGDEWSTRSAIDFVFDVVGAQDPAALVARGVVSGADRANWDALRSLIFDHDAEGTFIREGVGFFCHGEAINPDGPLGRLMGSGTHRETEWVVEGDAGAVTVPVDTTDGQNRDMLRLGVMMFLHQLKRGYVADVTRDDPDLMDLIAEAEKERWLEIDVKRACYALSAQGERHYAQMMKEAQDLVLRYDIYGDVDVRANGEVLFDTGLGDDWRVAMFEYAGLDPFHVRFLVGLNDGEWDNLTDWPARVRDARWFGQVFAPLESALGVDDIGRQRIERALQAGRDTLRDDGAWAGG